MSADWDYDKFDVKIFYDGPDDINVKRRLIIKGRQQFDLHEKVQPGLGVQSVTRFYDGGDSCIKTLEIKLAEGIRNRAMYIKSPVQIVEEEQKRKETIRTFAPALICYDSVDKAVNYDENVPDLIVVMPNFEKISLAYSLKDLETEDPNEIDTWVMQIVEYFTRENPDEPEIATEEEAYLRSLGYFHGLTDKRRWDDLRVRGVPNITGSSSYLDVEGFDYDYGSTSKSYWTDPASIPEHPAVGEQCISWWGSSGWQSITYPDRVIDASISNAYGEHLVGDGWNWDYVSAEIACSGTLIYPYVARVINPGMLKDPVPNTDAWMAIYSVCTHNHQGPVEYHTIYESIDEEYKLICICPGYNTEVSLFRQSYPCDWHWLYGHLDSSGYHIYYPTISIYKVKENYCFVLCTYVLNPTVYPYGFDQGGVARQIQYTMVYEGIVYSSQLFTRIGTEGCVHEVIALDGVMYYGSGIVRMVEIERTIDA